MHADHCVGKPGDRQDAPDLTVSHSCIQFQSCDGPIPNTAESRQFLQPLQRMWQAIRTKERIGAMTGQLVDRKKSRPENTLLNATLVVALSLMTMFVLIVGQSILVPFAISILFWFIINALANFLRDKTAFGAFRLPGWAGLAGSLTIIFAVCVAVAEIVAGNLQAMADRVPQYAQNSQRLSEQVAVLLGSDIMGRLSAVLNGLDLESAFLGLANGAVSTIGSVATVALYVAFLLVEQQFLGKKLRALSGNTSRSAKIAGVFDDIGKRIRLYLLTKSLTSAAMAAVIGVFLAIAGIDFSGFWVFLVFVLNFVPVIGGIVSGVLPAMLALLQFSTLGPFFIVVAGVATAHIIIGNIVEPRFVGTSVNLSPLVVILALAIWGFIWGVPGMFLCVPLTVIAMIVFSQFKSTQKVAIALSEKGTIG